MNIKTKTPIKNLKGEPMKTEDNITVFTLGQALANVVISAKEGGKMKLYLLGTKLYQDDNVEVDEADLTLLKNVVRTSDIYGALILGQCEILLEEVKVETKEAKKK